MTNAAFPVHRLAIAGLLGLVALVGCGGDDESDSAPAATAAPAESVESEEPAASDADATITISGFSFGDPLTVSPGTTVTVTNDDGSAHTWTSSESVFASPTLEQGDSFDFTFDEAGEFGFVCLIHPAMTGSITVA